MSDTSTSPLRLWGRPNSVNVQKVLWCLDELAVPFERIDAGMQFGHVDSAAYRAKNPNGRVPTLEHDGFVLWESHSVMRYLCLSFDGASLYPGAPRVRGGLERWLDWVLSTLQPAERNLFWGLVRTPPAERDMTALQTSADAVAKLWEIIDTHLAGRLFLEGDTMTIADISVGAFARRWFGLEGVEKPSFTHLRHWYDGLAERPGFQRYVAAPLS
jgi:glutathione S-transferase